MENELAPGQGVQAGLRGAGEIAGGPLSTGSEKLALEMQAKAMQSAPTTRAPDATALPADGTPPVRDFLTWVSPKSLPVGVRLPATQTPAAGSASRKVGFAHVGSEPSERREPSQALTRLSHALDQGTLIPQRVPSTGQAAHSLDPLSGAVATVRDRTLYASPIIGGMDKRSVLPPGVLLPTSGIFLDIRIPACDLEPYAPETICYMQDFDGRLLHEDPVLGFRPKNPSFLESRAKVEIMTPRLMAFAQGDPSDPVREKIVSCKERSEFAVKPLAPGRAEVHFYLENRFVGRAFIDIVGYRPVVEFELAEKGQPGAVTWILAERRSGLCAYSPNARVGLGLTAAAGGRAVARAGVEYSASLGVEVIPGSPKQAVSKEISVLFSMKQRGAVKIEQKSNLDVKRSGIEASGTSLAPTPKEGIVHTNSGPRTADLNRGGPDFGPFNTNGFDQAAYYNGRISTAPGYRRDVTTAWDIQASIQSVAGGSAGELECYLHVQGLRVCLENWACPG